MALDRERLKHRPAQLAAQNVFIGTSSWKYSGWCGLLYDETEVVDAGVGVTVAALEHYEMIAESWKTSLPGEKPPG